MSWLGKLGPRVQIPPSPLGSLGSHDQVLVAVDQPHPGLVPRPDDHLVDVDMAGPGGHEGDDVGHVIGGERRDALVDRGGPLVVAVEADQRELRLHHAPDRSR